MDAKIEEQGTKLASAIERKNGVDAARILDEVGACGWSEVFDAAKKASKATCEAVLSGTGKSLSGSERASLYLNSSALNPFALSSSPPCRR